MQTKGMKRLVAASTAAAILMPVMFMVIATVDAQSTTNETSSPEENFISIDDDAEQELSSQLQEIDIRAHGWTGWSEWSSCSRSCDGGVAHQLRRCQLAACKGDRQRYKICNMQPCPDSHEFREDQCAAYDSQPYEGVRYKWTPHYDDVEPCVLTCRGRPLKGAAEDYPSAAAAEDALLVVVRLADKVHDGTRCRPGSLDMCIGGKCQRVGCDLRIGSKKQIDSCGICGGDGSSCNRPLYHWSLDTFSFCSATCGRGYKMSRPVCHNRVSGDEVEEQLCNLIQKPEGRVVPCNTHNCPPKWHIMDWAPCSTSCGGGTRIRQVHCVEEANNTKIKINEAKCSGRKPHSQESCNLHDCPRWDTSQWSGCSVSCGQGVQVRSIKCLDHKDEPSVQCALGVKPTRTQPCVTGIQCPLHLVEQSGEDDEVLLLPGLYHTQPLIQPYPPPAPAHAERLVGEQTVPSESTFIPDEWGPCSVSCGEGLRHREVHCKIFLEFSRTIAKLPDRQCSGPKPPESEKCFMEPCSSSERIDIKDDPYRQDSSLIKVAPGAPGKTYSWQEQGYTHCSATCLGGVQELIVNCVRDDTQKVTSPYLCPRELKPEILIRTCNDHPCPPRWNYSDFQPCTQSCGIGIQTREVNCIHEVTHGGGNTVVVPNNMCPQPQPPDRQYCNVLDCPVRWRVGEWSKCSQLCGGGEKTRKVECKQVMAQNHTVDRAMTMCPMPRPMDRKPCNTKSCVLDTDKPVIETSNTTFIQHDPKKKKISLKIGGAATVFHGTIIKIKCPVKRFNRTRIQWAKDHNYLPKTKKYKTSKKGALRVQNLTYRDSGVYTCVAGRSSADLTLNVRPKPGEFINSEEVQRQAAGYSRDRHRDLHISDRRENRDDLNPIFDDHSHEQRPDGIGISGKQPKKSRTTAKPHKTGVPGSENNINTWRSPPTTPRSDEQPPSRLPSHNTDGSGGDGGGGGAPGKPSGAAASSASRNLPHFQQLISNLQSFGNSRGHRMVQDEGHVKDEDQIQLLDEEDDEASVVVLGKGAPEQLQFEWAVSAWTSCSVSCGGGGGVQMRTAHCVVRLRERTQRVEGALCEDAGVESPSTVRKCGLDACPKWVVSAWTLCEESKCFTLHKAIQRREIQCILPGNVTLPNEKCDQRDKPNNRQECPAERCVGTWRTGSWSKCSATCDSPGVKYRILQCVWTGTKKPAGAACSDLQRPPVMKSCKGPPCPPSRRDECKDHSIFCPNVKTMNMCRLHRYQQQCCLTCQQE